MKNEKDVRIGILRETKKPVDTRVPLTPQQCRLIKEEYPGTEVLVQPSPFRCFSDAQYRKAGIVVAESLEKCDIMLGIKEVNPTGLLQGKTYFFFSHTIKKQKHNKQLLKAVLEKQIRLVDYEMLTDSRGIRIIGFGRWAGLIGSYQGMRALCQKQGLQQLPAPQECRSLKDMMNKAAAIHLPPIRIALIGDGRVAGGAEEMMQAFGIKKVTMADYLSLTTIEKPFYVQLDPEKYNKRKNGEAFELRHFFSNPGDYESNFDLFCIHTDLLVMAAYWDPRAPVLFLPQQMKDSSFRIKVIADITCDLNGSVPSTIRVTNFEKPYYDFNPSTGKEEAAFSNPSNITVMSIDNLPCGLPREASEDFGQHFMRNVISLMIREDPEKIIERATIAEKGELSNYYHYLADWVNQQD